jgi:hypothetical protein
MSFPELIDLRGLKVLPVSQKECLSSLDKILVDPASVPGPNSPENGALIKAARNGIRHARGRGASVMLIFGAHLVKNGAMAIVNELTKGDFVTHLATNGAGTIHDWELAFHGKTEESVRRNVATGTFGTWDEIGRSFQLALMAGALRGEGFGQSLGRFVAEDGTTLPTIESLADILRKEPEHPLASARAELLHAIKEHRLPAGRMEVKHPFKGTSLLAHAFTHDVPFTVHPGIGYDIINNHPMYKGAVIGRAADIDFRLFCRAVEGLDEGVVLSVGSAIMGPQVFEKALSCVNNLRLQAGRPIVRGHQIYIVDLQDGGNWDWSTGEPPKDNPAYYLRFCKSFSRMGGTMHYVQSDNVIFLHHLLATLSKS